jgi:hypothetical protein
VGSNPTLSATPFILLSLQDVVSIMVSALHWFTAYDHRKRGSQTCQNEVMATAAKIASTSSKN